jgi:hypothetical protein
MHHVKLLVKPLGILDRGILPAAVYVIHSDPMHRRGRLARVVKKMKVNIGPLLLKDYIPP